jgi:hypothetical protein
MQKIHYRVETVMDFWLHYFRIYSDFDIESECKQNWSLFQEMRPLSDGSSDS